VSHVQPHQPRHTSATTLVNGGMSLEALMASSVRWIERSEP
jgi:site-specific recombinase XerD